MPFCAKYSFTGSSSFCVILTKKALGASLGNWDCQSEIMSFFSTIKNNSNLIASEKLISCTALTLARFWIDAIANDQLLPGFKPSFRPPPNINLEIKNNTKISASVEANKIRVILILLLNNHINKNTVKALSPKWILLTARRSPKLRRSTLSGGISNKSNNGLIENITAQITPVLIATNHGLNPAMGSSVTMLFAT